MKIGIDARVLLGRKTGDRTYTYNIVRALTELDTPHEFILYFDQEPDTVLKHNLGALKLRIRERPHGYLWTLIALPQLAREDALDLLHVQYLTPRRCPCPIISTIHDISFKLYPQWFTWRDKTVMNLFLPGSLRRTAGVITASQSTAGNIASEYDYQRDKIFVTPYAASEDFLVEPDHITRRRCREKYQIPGPYMLYVGNMQPRKNIARLIRSFVQARKTGGFSEQLLLAGQFGWRCARERRLIDEASAAGYVRHLGYVDDDDLPPLYAQATAFLFPTLHEGFGLPVLEAMAVGTPVLTANVSSMLEVAGDAALLVDPTDEAVIGTWIARLADDEKLRKELSRAGQAQARMFSWSKTAQLTVKAYEQVITSTRS